MLPNCILNCTILYLDVLPRHTLGSNPRSATDSQILVMHARLNEKQDLDLFSSCWHALALDPDHCNR